jgi:hypothetical protein
MKTAEWILEPGALTCERLDRNEKPAWKADAWTELNTPRAAKELRKLAITPTQEVVTTFLLRKFLLAPCWNDEACRKKWFVWMLPIVEQSLTRRAEQEQKLCKLLHVPK